MAYETKAIFAMIATLIAKADSLHEAYLMISQAANVEGVTLPSFDELKKELEEAGKKKDS